MSPDTASAIHSLNRTLEAMSGEANARLWSVAGLQSAEWDVVSRQARAAQDRWAADEGLKLTTPGVSLHTELPLPEVHVRPRHRLSLAGSQTSLPTNSTMR